MIRHAALAVLLAWGCVAPEPQPVESFGPEHARLAMLVGVWEARTTAEFDGTDATLSIEVHVQADWELGGRYVVARSQFEFTDSSSGGVTEAESVAWYTFDAGLGRYVYWSFSADGGVGVGQMDFDADTNTWRMEEQRGGVASGAGSMEYVSDTEKIVRWEGRPSGGPAFRIEGRSRRVR